MISIIIPTWNNYNDLKVCINSILSYTDLKDKEIIVVANGSPKKTINYLKSLKNQIKILEFPNPLGFSRAINEGLKIVKGEYVILLNDDTYLLQQKKDEWIEILMTPFKESNDVGITGPLKLSFHELNADFIVFFCAMIKKEVIDKIGMLDEIFNIGGGEDIDYCIRAVNNGYKIKQVPYDTQLNKLDKGRFISAFPIFHKAEATVGTLPNWQVIFENNMRLLKEKHTGQNIKEILHNNYERAVIDNTEQIPPREHIRYEYASKYNRGKRILDIGCSSGWGFRYFKDNPEIEYIGLDYDNNIIEYAKKLYKGYPNAKFICADINNYELEYYDTIIAFEVLEHLENGIELAQKLKTRCNQLFITVPYDETPGFWGEHHKLHHLTEHHFPDFKHKFITENGIIISKPNNKSTFYLLLLEWDRYGHYDNSDIQIKVLKENSVTATISTKNRYYSTLPLTLQSILNQTVKPVKIWIYDDSDEQKDLRSEPLYRHIFGMAYDNNVEIYVWLGQRIGQVANHNHALYNADTEYIWRIDDDCVAMPNTLEKYLELIKSKDVGAVGGRVIFADRPIPNRPWYANNSFKTKIEFEPAEWYKFDGVRQAEHLYSTFLYKTEAGLKAGGYNLNLSPVGHREETMFSHNIYRQGYKLLLTPEARTYHYHNPEGGIRAYKNPELWAKDEEIYQSVIKYEWNYEIPDGNIVVLSGGIGDCFAFKMILNEYLEKKGNILIATAYPDVFFDIDVPVISLEKAVSLIGDINKYNLYKFMIDTNFNGYILDAYRRLYLC